MFSQYRALQFAIAAGATCFATGLPRPRPAPFASFVEMETDKWARVLKFSGTKED
jgi:hypothetical protein